MSMDYSARLLLDTSDVDQKVGNIDRQINNLGKNVPSGGGLDKFSKAITNVNNQVAGDLRKNLRSLGNDFNTFFTDTQKGGFAERFLVGQNAKTKKNIFKDFSSLSNADLGRMHMNAPDEFARAQNLRGLAQFGRFSQNGQLTQRSLSGEAAKLAALPPMQGFKGLQDAIAHTIGEMAKYAQTAVVADHASKQLTAGLSGLKTVTTDEAIMFRKIQSAAQGMMMGFNVAQGSVTGVGFSMLFLRAAEIPILIATAAITVAVMAATAAFAAFANILKVSSDAAATYETNVQRLSSYFQSATTGAKLMGQALNDSIKYGLNPTDAAAGIKTLEKLKINSEQYRQAIYNTAVANDVSIASVAKDFEDLYTTQRFSYKETMQAFSEFAKKYNLSLNGATGSTAVAMTMQKRYADAAINQTHTLSGAVQVLSNLWDSVKIVVGSLVNEYVKPVLGLIMQFVSAIMQGFAAVQAQAQANGELTKGVANFSATLSRLLPLVTALGYFFGVVLFKSIQIVARIIKVATDAFLSFWHFTKPVRDLLQTLIQMAKGVVGPFIAMLKPLLDLVGAFFNLVVLPVAQWFMDVLDGLNQLLKAGWGQLLLDLGTLLFDLATLNFSKVGEDLKKLADDMGKIDWQQTDRSLNKMSGSTKTTLGKITEFISTFLGDWPIIFGFTFNDILTQVQRGWSFVNNTSWDEIKLMLHNIVETLGRIPTPFGETLGQIAGNIGAWFAPIIASAVEAMGSWSGRTGFVGAIHKGFDLMGEGIASMPNPFKAVLVFLEILLDAAIGVATVLTDLANKDLKAAIQDAGGVKDTIISGFRANGGPVTAGRAYVVGERRPEIFVPRSSGTILPSTGGSGMVVSIDLRGAVIDSAATVDHLANMIAGRIADAIGTTHNLGLQKTGR